MARALSIYGDLFPFIRGLERIVRDGELDSERLEALEYIYCAYFEGGAKPSKQELRDRYKGLRRGLEEAELQRRGEELNRRLMDSALYQEARHIFCYIDYRREVTTRPLLMDALEKKRLSVPVVRGEEMFAAALDSMEGLKPNSYGILEPLEFEPVAAAEIDLVIVPGLVFSPLGYRIGYGGGFYDRFLGEYRGRSAAMVLAEFISPEVVPESYDLPVERIFTL